MTESEIDELVEKQADDESAWEEPVRVRKTKGASISIPPDLAARAAFLAKLHRLCGLILAFYPKIGVHPC